MFIFFKKNKNRPKDLEGVLDLLSDLKKDIERLSQDLDSLKKEMKFSVQKVGIVRYNPFSEVGGDQSFSIALLDGNDTGVVITSLYTREGNRVYAKPIEKGQSKYQLSEEEERAIEKAISSKNPKSQIPNPK